MTVVMYTQNPVSRIHVDSIAIAARPLLSRVKFQLGVDLTLVRLHTPTRMSRMAVSIATLVLASQSYPTLIRVVERP